MRIGELLVAGGILGLAGLGVYAQLVPDAPAPDAPRGVPALAVGQALDPGLLVRDLTGALVPLGGLLGRKATVLYSWSTSCPCIPALEGRLRALHARFGPTDGVAWVAVAGEPTDAPAAVRARATELGAFYADTMLWDPTHRLCARVGFDRAALVAVLDADGYLRFRGNPDDDFRAPSRSHLAEVLPAVVAGTRPPLGEVEATYGCALGEPLLACPDADVAPPADRAAP